MGVRLKGGETVVSTGEGFRADPGFFEAEVAPRLAEGHPLREKGLSDAYRERMSRSATVARSAGPNADPEQIADQLRSERGALQWSPSAVGPGVAKTRAAMRR